MFLPSLMTCQTNQPPPLPAYLPYRVLGSTHNDHVHTTQPPPPLRYTPTRTQTHALTRTHPPSPPFPFRLLTVAGQRGRKAGGSRAASPLTPTRPGLPQCRSYVIYVCVHLTIWSMVCVCVWITLYYTRWKYKWAYISSTLSAIYLFQFMQK